MRLSEQTCAMPDPANVPILNLMIAKKTQPGLRIYVDRLATKADACKSKPGYIHLQEPLRICVVLDLRSTADVYTSIPLPG